MSYWILSKSGIQVSCTTVQRITNLKKQTYEYKEIIKDFGEKVEKWAVESSDLKDTIKDIPQPRRLCLKDEDEEPK